MRYEETSFGSADYAAACTLRDLVLRKPIGLKLSDKDTEGEEKQFHFIGRDETGQVVACVLFKPLGETHIKLRQMAVAEHLHGKGVGRDIVKFAETRIREKGFRTIETNARHYAQGFYEKLGYAVASGIFEEVGLHTLKMTKEL